MISSHVFIFQGMNDTDGEGTCLATLVYDEDGAAFQTFKLSVSKCVMYSTVVVNMHCFNSCKRYCGCKLWKYHVVHARCN